jgi:branched-subunit amino acid aminotransferase/4-amino-4-deoxychorismate lyase
LKNPPFVDLQVVNAQEMQGINACDRYLQQFQGEILQGARFSVFFIKGNKVVTPEARHPVESRFVVRESVMRESVIVLNI